MKLKSLIFLFEQLNSTSILILKRVYLIPKMISLQIVRSVIVLISIVLTIKMKTVQSQDVSSFLNQMMKNYVTKNARYYTILNGVPIQESEDMPQDNTEILSRISSIVPQSIANSPVLSQILDHDANSFPNSWTPMMSQVPSSSSYASQSPYPPQPHVIGRRNGEDIYRIAVSQQQFLPQESKIITVEDITPQMGRNSEFKIQSTMSF